MLGKQRHGKCSEWSPSAWTNASMQPFCHWSIASSTTLCWNWTNVSTSRCRNSSVSRIGRPARYARTCMLWSTGFRSWLSRRATCQPVSVKTDKLECLPAQKLDCVANATKFVIRKNDGQKERTMGKNIELFRPPTADVRSPSPTPVCLVTEVVVPFLQHLQKYLHIRRIV